VLRLVRADLNRQESLAKQKQTHFVTVAVDKLVLWVHTLNFMPALGSQQMQTKP